MITGPQARAARAFLNWTLKELGDRSGASVPTIRKLEGANGPAVITGGLGHTLDYRTAARDDALKKIEAALTKAGVTFLPDDGKGPGIRCKVKKGSR